MFNYVGSLVTNTDETETETKSRNVAGSKYYRIPGHSLKNIYIYIRNYIKRTSLLRRPNLTYRVESWTRKNKLEKTLVTWEMKILRKKYGPAYDCSYWRIQINQEIYNQFYYTGIVTVNKVRRLVRVCGT